MIPAMVYGWPSAVAYMSFLLCRTFPQAGGGMLDMDDCRTKHQVVDISNHFRVSLRSRCGNESSVFGVPKTVALNWDPVGKSPSHGPEELQSPSPNRRNSPCQICQQFSICQTMGFSMAFRRWIILPPFSWPRCCSSSMATKPHPEIPRKFGCACNNMWTIVNISKHLWKTMVSSFK